MRALSPPLALRACLLVVNGSGGARLAPAIVCKRLPSIMSAATAAASSSTAESQLSLSIPPSAHISLAVEGKEKRESQLSRWAHWPSGPASNCLSLALLALLARALTLPLLWHTALSTLNAELALSSFNLASAGTKPLHLHAQTPTAMSGQYGGFYSKQEQEDVMTTQITNPNRVGSGFINLGPQQRYAAPQQAANWQTGPQIGMPGGGAPQQVAQIWDAPAAPPKAPPPPARPPPQAFAGQQGGGAFPGQGPPPPQGGVNELFNSFGIDPNQQARAAAQAAAKAPPFVPPASMTMPPAPASVQQPFMNGGGVGVPQPGPSLMSMLGGAGPAPPPPQGLNPQFSNLANGSMAPPANRMGQGGPFAAMPPVNAMPPQAPQNNAGPPYGNNYHQGGGNHLGNHNNFRAQAQAQAPAPPPAPKTLSSAADYAAAAQQYKPPVAARTSSGPTVSISRKAESQAVASANAPRGTTPRAAEQREEWECARCTFLNNGSLWECEMCGGERPGKQEHAAAATREVHRPASEGWQTASKDRKQSGAAAAANASATSGKSKAQSKNEKRRAKKRNED